MFESFEDNFFFERTARDIDNTNDREELKKICKDLLSLYIRHKEMTKKLLLDKWCKKSST